MSMIRHNEGRLVVGVDLGGTQIRVLALTDGRPCGRYQGATTDEDGLGNLLRKLWKRQQWSARTVAALVVAAKGIWTEGERRSLAHRERRPGGAGRAHRGHRTTAPPLVPGAGVVGGQRPRRRLVPGWRRSRPGPRRAAGALGGAGSPASRRGCPARRASRR